MKLKTNIKFSVFQIKRKPFFSKFFFTLLALSGIVCPVWSQTDSIHLLSEISISSNKAIDNTPITTSILDRHSIENNKIHTSLPNTVEMMPSVVTSNENGQMGNSSFRIRGIDGTRVNVNINGVPLNDAESQMVYWVNIPNLAGMAQNIEMQRGIGSNMGGTASFGGALNLYTLNSQSSPYASTDFMMGSWNTHQYGISAGTGISKHGFSFDLSYNGLISDGFVRNGFCNHRSLFLSAGHYGDRSLLKAIIIIGKQRTGITWNGASAEELDNDPTYNNAGIYYDELGALRYYPDESDNYNQRHYQLLYSFSPTNSWTLNATADFTHGDGFYEQYFQNGINGYGFRLTDTGDCVGRMQENNGVWTGVLSARYEKKRTEIAFGGMALYFNADHFGSVHWNQLGPNKGNWYTNHGQKGDATLFARINHTLPDNTLNGSLNFFADFQLRYIDYRIEGPDEDSYPISFAEHYLFFNPKSGIHYKMPSGGKINFLIGIGNREPTRADIKDALRHNDTVKSEQMLDIEWGYARQWGHKGSLKAGVYAMLYHDQLTASGQLSEAGYALMENVDQSYRIGMEIEGRWQVCKWLTLNGNFTLSDNRIIDYVYSYSDFGGIQHHESLGNTQLAFSPATVGALAIEPKIWKNLRVQLENKFVGSMYCDNTSRSIARQPAYFLLNAKISYTWNLPNGSEIEAQMLFNNLLNTNYRVSAWIADYGTDGLFRGYYQQPGFNCFARLILKL